MRKPKRHIKIKYYLIATFLFTVLMRRMMWMPPLLHTRSLGKVSKKFCFSNARSVADPGDILCKAWHTYSYDGD